MEPRLVITAADLDDEGMATVVHEHAMVHTAPGSWLQSDLECDPWDGGSAVFTPRIKKATTPDQWLALQQHRQAGIDEIRSSIEGWAALDLIGSLGEPAYWPVARRDPWPDEGASRWEMKARNGGGDFMRGRVRKVAEIVCDRTTYEVQSGLMGTTLTDEAYERPEESRTATGLTPPRFTDTALAWCALWGISSFPVVHMVGKTSVTACALPVGKYMPERLVLPMFVGEHSLARWRAVLVSHELHEFARLGAAGAPDCARWLRNHGVLATSEHRLAVSDNSNAPERWLCDSSAPIPLPEDDERGLHGGLGHR
ncbi:hypothetical protein I6B53_09830 [Schaalia sp. 19OD2882]|uniref:hypothetical protein n=1 Tax=Schaalia sp. 19OD2882 TaxID=2794089 RepID=UPI001C1EFA0D|nr:hypothetical protein [Schaalia sp. 19OD2882]QWW19373.1 hypothetical protein I6B53_09830 [Schaalia sp. 19OD2882]